MTSASPRSTQPATRPAIGAIRVNWSLATRVQQMTSRGLEQPAFSNKEVHMSTQQVSPRRGWTVVLAGTAINLALGILYTWSIFKGAIAESISAGGPNAFNWDMASINDPYATACLTFAAAMILAGKLQDKFGPRLTCILGGLLVATGFVWISQTTSYWAWVVGFGVMAGMGIGFGYSAATPPALKWFPPAKTGLIAGIVVAGFGLASVYIAPLAQFLLGTYGLQQSMLYFGIGFVVITTVFGMLLANPPEGYVADPQAAGSVAKKSVVEDQSPSQILKSAKFYTLWTCFFIGSGAGLMVIGSAKGLAAASMGEMAFLVVAIMAVGNAAGRIIAGLVSDKIGRANTLVIMLAFQAALMFFAIPVIEGTYSNPLAMPLLVTFMVFNYGTNLSLFPSFAKDLWGAKNFGMNYGVLFSAWGIGAFALVRVAEMLKVKTGGFTMSFAVAGALLVVGAMLASTLRTRKAEAPAVAPAFEEEQELAYSKATND
ncbi:MAG: OFA family MFS transporter [Desulfuromonadales bacterium]|nr:OFA family MFS transporter [Desulfuromonadales bacterium]